MALGAALWKASEGFYENLTLATHGIAPEQAFARRPGLFNGALMSRLRGHGTTVVQDGSGFGMPPDEPAATSLPTNRQSGSEIGRFPCFDER